MFGSHRRRMVAAVMQPSKSAPKAGNFLDDCKSCIDATLLARKYANLHRRDVPRPLRNLLNECLDYTRLIMKFAKKNSEFSADAGRVAISIWQQCKVKFGEFPNPPAEFTTFITICDQCINSCKVEFKLI